MIINPPTYPLHHEVICLSCGHTVSEIVDLRTEEDKTKPIEDMPGFCPNCCKNTFKMLPDGVIVPRILEK